MIIERQSSQGLAARALAGFAMLLVLTEGRREEGRQVSDYSKLDAITSSPTSFSPSFESAHGAPIESRAAETNEPN